MNSLTFTFLQLVMTSIMSNDLIMVNTISLRNFISQHTMTINYNIKRSGPILILKLYSVNLIIFAMQYPQLCSNTPTTYSHLAFIFSIWHGIP